VKKNFLQIEQTKSWNVKNQPSSMGIAHCGKKKNLLKIKQFLSVTQKPPLKVGKNAWCEFGRQIVLKGNKSYTPLLSHPVGRGIQQWHFGIKPVKQNRPREVGGDKTKGGLKLKRKTKNG